MTKLFSNGWPAFIIACAVIVFLSLHILKGSKPLPPAVSTTSTAKYRYLHDTLTVADTATINRLQAYADQQHSIAVAALKARDFNLKQLHEVDNLFTDIRNNAVTDSIAIKTIADYLHRFIYNTEQGSVH